MLLDVPVTKNQAKTGNSSKDDGLVRVTATDRLGFPPQNHRQKLPKALKAHLILVPKARFLGGNGTTNEEADLRQHH